MSEEASAETIEINEQIDEVKGSIQNKIVFLILYLKKMTEFSMPV